MKRSLYIKFLIGYLIFGLLGVASIATVSSRLTSNYLEKSYSESLYDEASFLASDLSAAYRGGDFDEKAVETELQSAASILRGEVWVVDNKGTIVADSSVPPKDQTMITDFDPTFSGNRSYYIGDTFGMFGYDVLSVSAPITGNYRTYGYVIIHLPSGVIDESKVDILNIVYISCAIIFVLSLIILLVFTMNVYIPLKKITDAANQYAMGNLKHELKLHTRDEMGYLADTLNYMSNELDSLEEYQRAFIANVSHDFRSPLTSIKGYIEAILDGTIPYEMQEKYLNRVLSETERLEKLTEGLLTLNSLDNKGNLNRSNFDINRVIKDTAASFEGTCDAKNISFDLTFSEPVTMVHADLGKIQQVLYNLIDNAIKFSHNDSTIYIQTSIKYEKVFVSVKDTGVGIPKDRINKIWERFYKTDQSRGRDKSGTGLGLSIVKEIIQNHGENIDVISTEGAGTEFIFTLQRAVSSQ